MEEVELKRFVNPITRESVDESITEDEAKKRGYLESDFIFRHLEDENESIKFFIVNGKKIIVNIQKPTLQYKHPTKINHERVLGGVIGDSSVAVLPVVTPGPAVCDLDEGCISCSG